MTDRRHTSRVLLGTALLMCGLGADAGAAPKPALMRILANPPLAKPAANTHDYNIDVQLTKARIYNPASTAPDKYDNVELRTYWVKSGGMRPDSPLVGPTIEVHPGDRLRIFLNNTLDKQPGCEPPDHNTPNCFNYTNLHTHGLWVSPRSPSDDVLRTVLPKENFQYEFDIPPDHPAGTLWYHSHRHGSTALQTASGMSGALIVRGDRKPTMTANGDVDTLLAPLAPLERIMLFQQISYACGMNGSQPNWDCAGKTGTIDSYTQIGGGKWSGSGRYTSINGVVQPQFPGARAGRIERWRMIDGGIANTINVFIRGEAAGAPKTDGLTPAQDADWVKSYCTGDVVHQFAIATDGLTRSQIVERGVDRPTTLQPGYREDTLVVFPHPGHYCVIDTAAPAGSSISQTAESRQLLGFIDVAAGSNVADQKAYLQAQLIAASVRAFTPGVAGKVRTDLASPSGMLLTSFMPHKSLLDETKVGRQELAFDMQDEFTIANNLENKNPKAYDGSMERTLILGTTDEWVLTSKSGGHPFHIHVNPFQIVKILDPQGKDVSETGEPDLPSPDMQYADLKGQWKDSLFVKNGYLLFIRTKYERYDGAFVLHCHILDHEDKGMMEKIQICRPDDKVCIEAGKNKAPMKGMEH